MSDVEDTKGKREIEMVSPDSLTPYERNPRKHPEKHVDALVESIKEFGWTTPLFVADDTVLAGHGRLLAAKKMGATEVPVIRLDDLTPEQRRAYIVADNRLAEMSSWDKELLALELKELETFEFNLDVLGFTGLERASILTNHAPASDDDPAPEPPKVPVTQPGDVWILGGHRVMCGDSTLGADVDKLLDGAKPGLMVTDPPYGVNYDPEWRAKAGVNDGDRMGKVNNDDRASWREAYELFPGPVAYVWCNSLMLPTFSGDLEATGYALRALLIWNKPSLQISRGHYHWKHEPCLYAFNGKLGKALWKGGRKQSTVWDIELRGQDENTTHSTQKPVECMARPMRNHDHRYVYDPFVGSGTSVIAAEKENRIAFCMEFDPAYVDIIVQRWEKYTNLEAVLDNKAKTSFAVMAKRRAKAKKK